MSAACVWCHAGGCCQGMGWKAMRQVPEADTTPLVAPKTSIPGEWLEGGRESSSHRLAADADETFCQGSSSARGDSKGQPMKVLALLQTQPRAQLQAA